MAMASLPWQPQCAVGIGVRGRASYYQQTHLGINVKCPLILSDVNQN
jgi:hypothetical protein